MAELDYSSYSTTLLYVRLTEAFRLAFSKNIDNSAVVYSRYCISLSPSLIPSLSTVFIVAASHG